MLIEEWDLRLASARRDARTDTSSLTPPRPGRALAIRIREPVSRCRLAIVGLSAHFGPFAGKDRFENRVLGYEQRAGASPAAKLVGDSRVGLLPEPGLGQPAFPGYYIDSLEFGIDQFRIPPKELAEMQPQQSLMLRVAAEAIARCALGCATSAPDGRA